jgi:4-hydroxybenzoate polyprenyltransferase
MISPRMAGLLRLTRWQDHLLFTIPATLLGVNMALDAPNQSPDARVLLVLAANSLAVTFAFMVNDIEDAPDDARDPERAARNAVAIGAITPRTGWIASGVVGMLALGLFAGVNALTLRTGALTLLLGWLYSWRAVRLKALPVIDVIAHLLMLSSLLFLAGYFAFKRDLGAAWWITAGVGFISAYGQLYNQLRDYDMDQAAGLRNTASVLGARYTQWAMYVCLAAGIMCLGISALVGLWPVWLMLILLGSSPVLLLVRADTDMRGTAALDITGRAQLGAMVMATLTMIVWLVVAGID